MTSRARVVGGTVTIVVFLGALAFMITSGLEEGMARSVMAQEVAAKPHDFESQLIAINGYVVKRSMRHPSGMKLLKFQIWSPGDSGEPVNVEFEKVLPDTVKDGGQVCATGRLKKRDDGRFVFEANEIVGKCPTKYQPTAQQVVVPDFDPSTAP